MPKCGPGNTSFPVNPPAAADRDLYESVRDTIGVEFKLGPRANAPVFVNTGEARIDEGGGSGTYIRYNSLNYRVVQAQITKPEHRSWILSAATRANNVADLTITFQSSSSTANPKYIFMSIPILRQTATVIDPLYIAALAGQNVNGPFSLSQCIPSIGDYAAYTTCLEPNPFNAFCIVFYQGLSINGGTLDAIATLAGNAGVWPSFKAPTDVTLNLSTLPLTPDAFRAAVRINTVGAAQTTRMSATRVDNTRAYQCVPLDPDRDIANGKLVINTSTGIPQPMTKLLGARESARKDVGGSNPLNPGEIETIIAIFLGIILSLGLLVGGVYLYYWYRDGSLDVINSFPAWVRESPWIVFTGVLFCFIGFLIGAFTGRSVPTASDTQKQIDESVKSSNKKVEDDFNKSFGDLKNSKLLQ